jgi:glycosyltransferase involved in cell wall biosynthesis
MGCVVDRFGIDWWDVVGLLLQPELQDVRLALRLAEQLRGCRTLVATQRSLIAEAVRLQLELPLEVLHRGLQRRLVRRALRRGAAVANLSFVQLRQVVYDKYDPHYVWRREFARPQKKSPEPVVLLPTAYSNVTKTAFNYARILPEQKFLLVLARESGAVSPVPANVQTASLAAFATGKCDQYELQKLEVDWKQMEQALQEHPAFNSPAQIGILRKGPHWLRWGLTVRDAWNQVFEARSVIGCLSADDSNPYTRIPLLLAQHRGIPAVACHHGALDCRMAFKKLRFSNYLAKGEMERDYLERICGVDGARIRVGAATSPRREDPSLWSESAPWIVFFSEPYETDSWRMEAIFREVLPRLCATARKSGKTLVLKLHPFESARQRRRLVTRALSKEDQKIVSVKDAPFAREILQKTWCAVTVGSTVAVECASVGIPTFLCGWLRHAYSGYAPQYARFGVGRMLESADDLLRIPETLHAAIPAPDTAGRLVQLMSPAALSEVLCQPQANGLR